MFSSNADVFRTRQTVADLIEVVRVHPEATGRIGGSGALRQAFQSTLDDNGRLLFPRASSGNPWYWQLSP